MDNVNKWWLRFEHWEWVNGALCNKRGTREIVTAPTAADALTLVCVNLRLAKIENPMLGWVYERSNASGGTRLVEMMLEP